MNNQSNLNFEDSIAIVGMDGRFPGAKNINELWDNLKHGRESIIHFSDDELLAFGLDKKTISDPNYVKAGAFLENIDLFDANFFGYNPKEASAIDPQHRIFLECAYSALENAGYNPDKYTGKIGIFAGVGWNNYLLFNLDRDEDFFKTALGYQTVIGNEKDFLTTRISYLLNLKGISLDIQTACSTSLIATSMACQSLLTYQSDMALAGGISIASLKKTGYLYQEGGILSPDGHCRAFDAEAQGTVPGSGVGIVVLKRLEDALADRDCIHAIIRGSAINNDGADKIGYTAPSIDGQAEVIAEALALAGVEPETISYIETHGTGTVLGDPIEIAALSQVFGDENKIALGSVKTNIGHLDAAAGITGLIKTVLALKHQEIPPSLHFQQPNPKINFANSPFYVNTELKKWQTAGYPRRAGVSSFGIGGTNVHVVLEEAISPYPDPPALSRIPLKKGERGEKQRSEDCLLVISAKTESALETATDNLVEHLNKHPELDLGDVAYTLQMGRKEFNYRRMVVGKDINDVAIALQNRQPQRVLTHHTQQERYTTIFMFPGQGSQYVNMGKELYETEPVFREWIDRCCRLLEPELGWDLRESIYPADGECNTATEKLKQTKIAQPAIFTIEYALAQLWMSWGIKPEAAIGHSIGEYVAATIAGVFSLEDALHLVARRGKLIQQMPTGSMLAVSLSETEAKEVLTNELSLAASNGSNLSVISGSDKAIALLEIQLKDKGIECRHLHTSHAFHSSMMDDAIVPLAETVGKVELNPPQMPFISCVTGTWITPQEATNPHYWAKHMRETVRFAAGVEELLQDSNCILLEVGAGRTLSTFVRHNSIRATGQIVLSSLPHPKETTGDCSFILNMLGRLWLAGVAIDWGNFFASQQYRRVPLPTYPFERQRYWIESKGVEKKTAGKKANIADWFYIPTWKNLPLVETSSNNKKSLVPSNITPLASQDGYLIFAKRSLVSEQIIEQLSKQGEITVVYSGEQFDRDNDKYAIDPNNPEDYQRLFKAIAESGNIPTKIIYLWSITPLSKGRESESFSHLLYLTQALDRQQPKHEIEIIVATKNFYDVIGNETLSYNSATVLGALKVIPQEYAYLDCRQVDFDLGESTGLEQLISEFTSDSTDKCVAYRNHRRWVQSFEAISLNTKESSRTRFYKLRKPQHISRSKLKQGGVYLITGGMGGIGLTLAEHLARTVQAKLILLGRSTLPKKETWDEWLATHDPNDSISQKIQKIKNLEALKAEVLPLSADVCNYDSMEQAIALAVERFGTINGVIHAAGIAGGGMIQLKTPEVAESVFAPKVTGTLVLHEVLKSIDLDFMVLCSSLTSIVGGFGQADYCAANAFLDAFARNNRKTISINWDAWQEVGMAVNTEVPLEMKQWQEDNLQYGLLPTEAVKVFDRILNSGLSRVIVSTQDLARAIADNNNFLANYQTQVLSTSQQNLSQNYVAPSKEIEKTIAKIWQEVIGFEKIGIHDNFFELGGHSLLAVQVTSRLRETFKLDLPLRTLLFETPTIAQLAAVIGKHTSVDETESMEQLLAEIENLSPEELARELARQS